MLFELRPLLCFLEQMQGIELDGAHSQHHDSLTVPHFSTEPTCPRSPFSSVLRLCHRFASRANKPEIQSCDIGGLKYFDRLRPLLERSYDDGANEIPQAIASCTTMSTAC